MNERAGTTTIVNENPAPAWHRRISWGSIFAGTLIAIGIQILLGFLGAAIGLAAVDPTDPGALSVGGAIWLIISGFIALFCGGWVAGRLSGELNKLDRIINALVVWGLVIVLSLYIVTSTAMAIISGAIGLATTAVGTAGQAITSAAPQVGQFIQQQFGGPGSPLGDIQNQLQQIFQQAQDTLQSPQSRQEIQQDLQTVTSALNQLFTEGEIPEQKQNQVEQILIRRGNMSQKEADSTLNAWMQTGKQIRQQVSAQADSLAKAAEEAADAVAAASAWIFVILLLDAVAAILGGNVAKPKGR